MVSVVIGRSIVVYGKSVVFFYLHFIEKSMMATTMVRRHCGRRDK